MSAKSPLHQRILDRCREAFGPPDPSLSREDHWSLKPAPLMLAINLMVNGSAELPAIWVFDPHNGEDPVMRVGIKNFDQVEEAILSIRDRINRAAIRYGRDGRDGRDGRGGRDGHDGIDGTAPRRPPPRSEPNGAFLIAIGGGMPMGMFIQAR